MSLQKGLVSVIIPLYNVERYVEEAIKSIQNQSYKNIEIIVIDDASTDNTYQILKRIAERDNRIKLYKNQRNLKIVKTLNYALTLANGEYIARMDGDDISQLDRIERKVRFLMENKEFDLVGCSVKAIDIEGNIIGKTVYYSNSDLLLRTLKYSTPVAHIWLARRNVYNKLNGYRELPGVEDYDFLLRMVTSGFRFTNLEDYFGYCVRIGRKGNTIDSLGIKQRKVHRYVYKLYKERLKKNIDSYSIENLKKFIKTAPFLEKIHLFSSKNLYKAIKAKNEKKYFNLIFYLVLSLCSIYQINYLFDRIIYRMIIMKHKK